MKVTGLSVKAVGARSAGVTLMELLVVLLIIGVLGTVAVRTIDATRGRALFDKTTVEMQELVNGITGNPNLVLDGRRIDFGYYGDMGDLPFQLRDLVTNPDPSNPRWRGPYLRRDFLGDSTGFLFDAWGNPYTYDRATGVISTIGDGKNPMTVRVIDTLPHLTRNSIVGTVADVNNNPPGELTVPVVGLYLADGQTSLISVDQGGYYAFHNIPIGTHRLVAYYITDSITRWISVAPRTQNVVDFRFTRPFGNFIKMVGQPQLVDGNSGFSVSVVNTNDNEVKVRNVLLVEAPLGWFRNFTWNGDSLPGWPVDSGQGGYRMGDAMPFNRSDPAREYGIQGGMTEQVSLGFRDCRQDSLGLMDPVDLAGTSFRLRFSDGSEIMLSLP